MAQKKITDLELRSAFDATCNLPVDDSTETFRVTGAQLLAYLRPLIANFSNNLYNLAMTASVAANALTVALKTQANADASSTDPILIGFRSSTLTSGVYNLRTLAAAMSITVPSGATLGTIAAGKSNLYLYALDNAGSIELGICNGLLDESILQSSTILNTSSDSAFTLYSTTARANVPVRLIGVVNIAEATPGTWATAPTSISVKPIQELISTKTNPYSPAITGLGTITNNSAFWWRHMDRCHIRGSVSCGTPTAAALTIPLPAEAGLIDFTKLPRDQTGFLGIMYRAAGANQIPSISAGPFGISAVSSATSSVYPSLSTNSATPGFTTTLGNALANSTDVLMYEFSVPCVNFA